jgi:hypothetical protein
MATRSLSPSTGVEPVHNYHADAYLLSADIQHPIERDVEHEGYVEINEESNGESLYQYQPASRFNLQGVLSYESGYTQVAGHKSPKTGGFTTLATSVVEGLNILDVITADRVVGQISTEHPIADEGQVPGVTFLGTRFENLRIAGHKVDVERQLDIIGPKPARDKSYFDDPGVLNRISKQYSKISGAKVLPAWASQQFRWNKTAVQKQGVMQASVVRSISGAPGISFGHVIDLPHFGKIFLGELKVDREPPTNGGLETYRFHLTMIRLELGCLAQGTASFVAMDTNGKGQPPPKPIRVPPPPPPK